MYIFRKHNQESDHWANLGADGMKTVIVVALLSGEAELYATGRAAAGWLL